MRATDWITTPVSSLLDVGCNAGVWLRDCARRFPSARLAGVEINQTAIMQARANVPSAELRDARAEDLPFADETFEYVTCLEVLEHLPADVRPAAFREMQRVLLPGGSLILTVPHAGWFAWLDSNNVRFRLPNIYRWILGRGRRDNAYAAYQRGVEWHHHFTEGELAHLAGGGWEKTTVRQGGLVLYPLMDWLSWPFYRLGIPDNPMRRLFERVAVWDYDIDFGKASYGVLIVLRRAGVKPEPSAERPSPSVCTA